MDGFGLPMEGMAESNAGRRKKKQSWDVGFADSPVAKGKEDGFGFGGGDFDSGRRSSNFNDDRRSSNFNDDRRSSNFNDELDFTYGHGNANGSPGEEGWSGSSRRDLSTPSQIGKESMARSNNAQSNFDNYGRREKALSDYRNGDLGHDYQMTKVADARATPMEMASAFDAMDRNHDGVISRAEFNQAYTGTASAPLGFGPSYPNEFGSRPRRLERGFSFSLQDMPDAPGQGSPYAYREGLAQRERHDHLMSARKWNPLESISRNWFEAPGESVPIPVPPMPLPITAQMAVPSWTVSPYGQTAYHQELLSRSDRIEELKQKISQLEGGMPAGAQSQQEQHMRICVNKLNAKNQLGVGIKRMAVQEIPDQSAHQWGWAVGDKIIQINGYPVTSEQELQKELNKAIAAYKENKRPLVFDITRGPNQMQSHQIQGQDNKKGTRTTNSSCCDCGHSKKTTPQHTAATAVHPAHAAATAVHPAHAAATAVQPAHTAATAVQPAHMAVTSGCYPMPLNPTMPNPYNTATSTSTTGAVVMSPGSYSLAPGHPYGTSTSTIGSYSMAPVNPMITSNSYSTVNPNLYATPTSTTGLHPGYSTMAAHGNDYPMHPGATLHPDSTATSLHHATSTPTTGHTQSTQSTQSHGESSKPRRNRHMC